MNVAGLFSMQRGARRGASSACGGVLVVASALCGCADLGRVGYIPPVNPESPVAAQVSAAAKQSYPFPRFRDVPSKPTDVRTPAQFKTAVVDQVRCRRAVEGWVAAHPQLNLGAEQFAEQTRAEVPPLPPPSPEDVQLSETEAERLRAFAKPPPPIEPRPRAIASAASAPTHAAPSAAASPTAPAPSPAPPPVQTAQASSPLMPAPLADPILNVCK